MGYQESRIPLSLTVWRIPMMDKMFNDFLFVQTLTTREANTITGMAQNEDGIFLNWINDDEPEVVRSVRISNHDADDVLRAVNLTLQLVKKAMTLGEPVCSD
jgi:hypothetical protein